MEEKDRDTENTADIQGMQDDRNISNEDIAKDMKNLPKSEQNKWNLPKKDTQENTMNKEQSEDAPTPSIKLPSAERSELPQDEGAARKKYKA